MVRIIYVDQLLEQVKTGKLSVMDVAQDVIRTYHRGLGKNLDSMVSLVLDKHRILEQVVYRVIGAESNKAYLADKPYWNFLDLAVVYSVVMWKDCDNQATIVITDALCKAHSISVEELEEAARKNTEANGFCIRLLADVLANMLVEFPKMSADEPPMWICSNQHGINGAAIILYCEYFAKLAETVGTDLYILPSSIHEVLAVPADAAPKDLKEIVAQINTQEVSADEVLSNNVYLYSCKTGKITVA